MDIFRAQSVTVMVKTKKALWIMLVSGGAVFWTLAALYSIAWVFAIYVARFSVPLVNGYALQSNNVSSKAAIYDSNRKLVLADVDDFSVSKGYVFGYTAVSAECFLLDTKTGVLIYPISNDELYRLIDKHTLGVNFTNVLTLRASERRPYWDSDMQTGVMEYRFFDRLAA